MKNLHLLSLSSAVLVSILKKLRNNNRFQKYHVQLHNNYAFMGNFPKLNHESNH